MTVERVGPNLFPFNGRCDRCHKEASLFYWPGDNSSAEGGGGFLCTDCRPLGPYRFTKNVDLFGFPVRFVVNLPPGASPFVTLRENN
jgi:hypothetical protein